MADPFYARRVMSNGKPVWGTASFLNLCREYGGPAAFIKDRRGLAEPIASGRVDDIAEAMDDEGFVTFRWRMSSDDPKKE